MCKIGVAIVGQFLVFFIKFSLNIGKGTIIGNLLLGLLGESWIVHIFII